MMEMDEFGNMVEKDDVAGQMYSVPPIFSGDVECPFCNSPLNFGYKNCPVCDNVIPEIIFFKGDQKALDDFLGKE
ncbi:MAG: hypothetical protein Q4B64_11930 [Spirochaetales bacterium]|nr:hypothetical protein [Spirochaetales bacterium]